MTVTAINKHRVINKHDCDTKYDCGSNQLWKQGSYNQCFGLGSTSLTCRHRRSLQWQSTKRRTYGKSIRRKVWPRENTHYPWTSVDWKPTKNQHACRFQDYAHLHETYQTIQIIALTRLLLNRGLFNLPLPTAIQSQACVPQRSSDWRLVPDWIILILFTKILQL